MTYYEWCNEWERKCYDWRWKEGSTDYENFEKYMIAYIKFPNSEARNKANHYLYDRAIFGKDEKNMPCGCCAYCDDEFTIKIHRICPNLPLVLKVFEYCGGSIAHWNTSLLEVPPVGGGVWTPQNNTSKSTSKSGSGCYIATACYGSYDCTQVLTFRHFRDEYLNETFAGRIFIKTYYAITPSIARWLKNKHTINTFIRKNFLDKIYNSLKRKY